MEINSSCIFIIFIHIGYEYSIRSRACGYVDNFAAALIVEESRRLNTTNGGVCLSGPPGRLWMKSGSALGVIHRFSAKL